MEPERHVEINRHLQERAIRYTNGRQTVVGVLQRAKGPQSAAELHRRLRGRLPLSSLYRSLAILDEAGILRRHHDVDGLARYELAEWLRGHHHHVVCNQCGEVTDIELDDDAEKTLLALVGTVGNQTGHAPTGHVLEIEGVCSGCAS